MLATCSVCPSRRKASCSSGVISIWLRRFGIAGHLALVLALSLRVRRRMRARAALERGEQRRELALGGLGATEPGFGEPGRTLAGLRQKRHRTVCAGEGVQGGALDGGERRFRADR